MGKTTAAENYYDILNVRSDCTDKEIKASYVQLSKKFHPDVNSTKPNSQKTARFLKISEAYQTLSKPKLRFEYDRNIRNAQHTSTYEATSAPNAEYYRHWEIRPDYDPNPGPYYGIKGLNRIKNSKVALVLIVLGIFGGVFGVTSVKQSFSLNHKHLDEVSAKANEHHQKIRSEVEKHSKDEQLQRVIDRITNRAER